MIACSPCHAPGPSGRFLSLCALLASWASCLAAPAAAEEMHRQIDSLVKAAASGASFAPLCDDYRFVRRIYLDLAGRIPTPQETEQFVAKSADPNRRVQLIDSLLAGRDYPRRMQDLFHAMLMERRGDNAEWTKFLQTSFEANKPWDRIAREILDPNPDDEAVRGAAFFHVRRLEKVGQQETDYPGLTRDVGRMFLGMDLQCAQCHNHLFIDAYKQVDFQGLFTVYQNTFIRTDVKFPALGEKLLTKKTDFMSVFDKVALTTGPRVPGGKEIEIPTFEKDQEFLVKPDKAKNFPGVPKFRPMQALAQEISVESNRAFVDNFANRAWFVMMGRGLVHPLDQQHVGNRPSHPELLELLGRETIARKFDIKSLLRELALSETYQRSSDLPADGEAPASETYRAANERRLSAEQLLSSVLVATGPRDGAALNLLAAHAPAADAKPADGKATDATKSEGEKLRAAFVKAFANAPMEPEVDFAPSLKSALFVLNDASVLDRLRREPGNLIDRLLQKAEAGDATAVADELYLSVLVRKPTDDERQALTEYLAQNSERRANAITNLAWALLGSTEFCLNH